MCNFENGNSWNRDGTCVDCAHRIKNNQCFETHDANTSECMEECLQDSTSTDLSRIYQPVTNPNFEYNLEYNDLDSDSDDVSRVFVVDDEEDDETWLVTLAWLAISPRMPQICSSCDSTGFTTEPDMCPRIFDALTSTSTQTSDFASCVKKCQRFRRCESVVFTQKPFDNFKSCLLDYGGRKSGYTCSPTEGSIIGRNCHQVQACVDYGKSKNINQIQPVPRD